MSKIYLLDCTLRDGGYVNDWNFGNGTMTCIFDRLSEAGVDFIEIGFLDDRRPFDPDRTIQPSTDCYAKVYRNAEKTKSKMLAMIDYGTCDISHVEDCKDTILDGIRVIFKKPMMDGAMEFGKQLKKKGYKVFLNMVSITSYSDWDMLEFIKKANDAKPFAVSIVDTYGLMHKEQVLHYFDLLDHNLVPEIMIGYHSHNNFQLGYANAIEFLNRRSMHDKIIDGTLYGMGKSAGNAPLELIAMYLNESAGSHYDMNQIMEAIDNNILNIYREKYWGYAFNFYISALNDCHPNYVKYLLQKNTLSVKSVNDILVRIPEENKLYYNEELIKKLYLDYQKNAIDDSESLKDLYSAFDGHPVLIIGPGRSISKNKKSIEEFIRKKKPITISINHISEEIPANYLFISNSKRFNLIYPDLLHYKGKIIATSNITPFDKNILDFTVNYDSLAIRDEEVVEDDSLTLLLNLLNRIGLHEVALAGLDGFTGNASENYADDRMILSQDFDPEEFNSQLRSRIERFRKGMSISFLTKSLYDRSVL